MLNVSIRKGPHLKKLFTDVGSMRSELNNKSIASAETQVRYPTVIVLEVIYSFSKWLRCLTDLHPF